MPSPLETQAHRQAKDQFFRTHRDSPIPPAERAHFAGLRYYPFDARFVVASTRAPPTPPRTVSVQTSDGDQRTYNLAATLDFTVPTGAGRLEAYADRPGERRFFIPFRDATAPHETYGAGRYLDVEAPPSGPVTLDFNAAYNPYCAYNDAYSCPFPPRANWLGIPIPAGEKNYLRPDA